jgi:hypothetical protein
LNSRGWFFFGCFVFASVVNVGIQHRLETSQADLHALAAFHNGLVAGRGCWVPE